LPGKKEGKKIFCYCLYEYKFLILYSQVGSILAIIILPSFTRAPTAHQMSIQQCEVQDGKLSDIRDYSSIYFFL